MTADPKYPFENALAALLVPMARAMLGRGITIGVANEAMKHALVQAALEEGGLDISDSRVSLRTGLHRKDVKRLRALDTSQIRRKSINAAAMVISYWASASKFQGTNAKPRDLPRTGSDDAPGFDELVRLTRIDVAPGSMLTLLIDQRAVEALSDGTYRLLTRALLPSGGGSEQVAAYQATLSAHLAAATHNLLAEEGTARHFDRIVRYSHLSAASVEILSNAANTKAQMLLEEINAMAHSLQLQDEDSDTPTTGRFAFGAYLYPTLPKEPDAQ